MRFTVKQQARILKTIGQRYPREITVAMSRQDFNALIAEVGGELYGKKA